MRTKQIFDRDEISHIWVYGRYRSKKGFVPVTEGRTKPYTTGGGWNNCYGQYLPLGNQHFTGNLFYSYNTVIAKRYDLGAKGWLYLVSDHDYGSTTRSQVWNLWRAIPNEIDGKPVHKFKFDTTGRFPNGVGKGYEAEFVSIADFLVNKALDSYDTGLRAKVNRESHKNIAGTYLREAERLRELLELGPDDRIATIRANIRAIPEYVVKPPNPNRRQYITNWEQAHYYLPNLPMLFARAFKAGEKKLEIKLDGLDGVEGKVSARLLLSACPIATIKLVGDQVLTSKGARMSKEEAESYYVSMLNLLATDSKQEQKQYLVTRTPNSFIIGCHRFHITTIVADYLHLIGERSIDYA